MDSSGSSELRQLRQELQGLLRWADDLARRIEALESTQTHAEGPEVWEGLPEAMILEDAAAPAEAAPPPTLAVPPPPPAETKPVVTPPPPPAETRPVVAPPPPVEPEPVVAATPPTPEPVPRRKPEFIPPPPVPGPVAARAAKAPAEKRDWEFYLGSYLVPRIGIFLLATSAVLFLAWAWGQWGAAVRVAIGYAVCAALLVLGRLAEKKYADYARVLYSGGFLLSYFVTYAAHFIPGAKVIDSLYVELRLLALVVAAWAVAAQWRQSKTMAILVLGMAHYTIYLSGPAPYSAFAILMLSGACAFFLLWNRWYAVAMVGLFGSYLNQTLWMIHNRGANLPQDFWISMGFLAGHFALFALADLFSREEVRRKEVPTWFRTLFVSVNSAIFLLLASIVTAQFSFSHDSHDLLYFIFAGVLLVLGLAYLRVQEGDPVYNAYLTKGVAVATLGLAFRYDASALSAWLAVESVVLLVSARRSGLVVTRVLALIVGAITLLHGMSDFAAVSGTRYGDADFWARAFEASLTVVAMLGAALLYEKTNWNLRSPQGERLGPDLKASFYALGFVSEPPRPDMKRPLDGLIFAYAYALAAFVLYLGYTQALVNAGQRTLFVAVAGLVLTVCAAGLGSKPYGLLGVLFATVCLAVGSLEFFFDQGGGAFPRLASVPVAVVSLQALAITALFSERAIGGRKEGLIFHRSVVSPYLLYGIAAWLLGLLLVREYPGINGSVALLVAGAIPSIGTLWLHPKPLAAVSTGLLAWSLGVYAVNVPEEMAGSTWAVMGWVLTLLPLAIDRFYARVVRRGIDAFGWALVTLSWAALEYYLAQRTHTGWFAFASNVAAFAYLGYALGFRSMPAVAWSVVCAVLGGAAIVVQTFGVGAALGAAPVIAGYGTCAAYWMVLERLERYAVRRMGFSTDQTVSGLSASVAAALLVLMLARIPGIREYWLTVSWGVLALVLFGVAIAFRQRYYRYAALAIIGLAIGRAFVFDLRGLTGLIRVAAFAALSFVALLVGFGYLKAMEYLRKLDSGPEPPEPPEPGEGELPPAG